MCAAVAERNLARDSEGKLITISEDQCYAIALAIRAWKDICAENGRDNRIDWPAVEHAWLMISKSRLLGRILYEGREPLDEAPPLVNAEPAYWLTDPDLCPNCCGPRDEPGRRILTSLQLPGDQDRAKKMFRMARGRDIGEFVTLTYCVESWHPRPAPENQNESK